MLPQVNADAVTALILASIRVSAWLLLVPPFNSRLVPRPVAAMLAVGLALPVFPALTGQVPAADVYALLACAVEQVVVGASLGFITAMMLSAVQAAGDLLDLFGGLSLAFAFDPFSSNQSSVFGRFYQLLTMTLLFTTDGYQLIVRGFLQSFRTLPLDAAISVPNVARIVTDGLPAMFLAALQIAGPLIAVLFCADVALGLLNRVAPALNAFSLGFPAKILLVVVLSGFAITLLPQTVHALVEQAVRAVLTVARR